MKYKIEKNVYLAQPEIKTKQDEKQLLSFMFSRSLMRSRRTNDDMIVKQKRYDIIMAIEAEMFRLLFCAIKGGLQ